MLFWTSCKSPLPCSYNEISIFVDNAIKAATKGSVALIACQRPHLSMIWCNIALLESSIRIRSEFSGSTLFCFSLAAALSSGKIITLSHQATCNKVADDIAYAFQFVASDGAEYCDRRSAIIANVKAKLAFIGSSHRPPRRDVSSNCATALTDGFNLMIGTIQRLKDHAIPLFGFCEQGDTLQEPEYGVTNL